MRGGRNDPGLTSAKGLSNYRSRLVKRARMEGMVMFDCAERYGFAVKDIAQWMKDGKFVSKEEVADD